MESSEKQETIPMLARVDNDVERDFPQRHHIAHKQKAWSLLHIVLITVYSGLFFLVTYHTGVKEATSLTPLFDFAIKHKPKLYDDFEQSIYAGVPSPGLDDAWHDLLADMAIRVTEVELKQSNQTSVALPNGGYMAWLGVYHELHCIKMLRQWNYREHYYPNLTEKEAVHRLIHADHCLDLLRSTALCHGDTTLTTFRWDVKEKPMLNTKLIPHKCVDWQMLTDSVKHRAVEADEVADMVNPLLRKPE